MKDRLYLQTWHQVNKKRRLSKLQERNRLSKAELVAYKGGICHDCGQKYPDCCFDFDHRDPSEKSFSIGSKYHWPVEKLKVEIDKCDMVCANCHRIRTANNPVIAEKLSKAMMGIKRHHKKKNIP